jgi:hypothetical protein
MLKSVILVCLIILVGFLGYDTFFYSTTWENPPEMFGTRDLIAFWGGVHTFFQGGNPYNFNELFTIQKQALPSLQTEQYFLNPPWAIPLFAILMIWDFQTSRLLWLLFNTSALLLPTLLLRRYLNINIPNAIMVTICFMPAIMLIWYGQLSLLIYFFLIMGFFAYQRQYDLVAGLLWVPCTLKPHLCYLTGIVIFISLISQKRWLILVGGISGLAILNIVVLSINPTIFEQYANIDKTPLIYKSSTIPTLIRILWIKLFNYNPSWPVLLIPALATACVLYQRFKLIRSDHVISLEELCLYTCLSLALAPYAWMYDYSLLVIVQIVMFARSKRIKRPLKGLTTVSTLIFLSVLIPVTALKGDVSTMEYVLIGFIGCTIILLSEYAFKSMTAKNQAIFLIGIIQGLVIITGCIFKELLSFIWFPWGILAAWILIERNFKKSES